MRMKRDHLVAAIENTLNREPQGTMSISTKHVFEKHGSFWWEQGEQAMGSGKSSEDIARMIVDDRDDVWCLS